MMANTQKNKYQAYAAATQTVAKTQQIVMLYDGVIRLVQQAKEAIGEKRIEDRYHILRKAGDIIFGLQGCLDYDNGGEIANILFSFYSSIDSKLFTIQRTNDRSLCDEVINDLKQMREAWAAIDAGINGGPTVLPTQTSIEIPPPSATLQPTVTLSA